MIQILSLLIATTLTAAQSFDTQISKENTKAMENEKIKCRWVCDKKLYKEQKIAEAISYYKNSKEHNFTKKDF